MTICILSIDINNNMEKMEKNREKGYDIYSVF